MNIICLYFYNIHVTRMVTPSMGKETRWVCNCCKELFITHLQNFFNFSPSFLIFPGLCLRPRLLQLQGYSKVCLESDNTFLVLVFLRTKNIPKSPPHVSNVTSQGIPDGLQVPPLS